MKYVSLLSLAICGSVWAGGAHIPVSEAGPRAACQLDSNGKVNEMVSVVHGDTRKFVWGEGYGCLHRSIGELWDLTRDNDLMRWVGVNESESHVVPGDAKEGEQQIEVHYTVKRFITVRWVMDWLHQLVKGSAQEPQQIVISYHKKKGTRFIPFWEGTITLERVGPDVTVFRMRNNVNARSISSKDAAATVQQVYAKLKQAPHSPVRQQLTLNTRRKVS